MNGGHSNIRDLVNKKNGRELRVRFKYKEKPYNLKLKLWQKIHQVKNSTEYQNTKEK